MQVSIGMQCKAQPSIQLWINTFAYLDKESVPMLCTLWTSKTTQFHRFKVTYLTKFNDTILQYKKSKHHEIFSDLGDSAH